MEISMDAINIDVLTQYASLYGLKVLGALAIFFIGKWFVRMGTNLCKKLMEKANIDKTLVTFGGNIIYALGLTFVVVAAISQMGVETTSLAAIIAAAGLAVGLALQGSLSNLAAGVMIILFRPFRVGNYVEVAGTAGTVDDLNIFTTTLKTPDNKIIIVPNSKITDGNITNYSAQDRRRVDMVFGIGYGDDIKKAKEILKAIADADERILKEPAVQIAVSELGESSVNFVMRPWVKSGDYWDVKFEVTEKVKMEFDKNGISIPFPQRDVHVHADENIVKKLAA